MALNVKTLKSILATCNPDELVVVGMITTDEKLSQQVINAFDISSVSRIDGMDDKGNPKKMLSIFFSTRQTVGMNAKEIHDTVRKYPATEWLMLEKVEWIDRILQRYQTLYEFEQRCYCVEIGVWYGASSLAIALALRSKLPAAHLFSIDAWAPEASLEGTNSKENDEWWGKVDYDSARLAFQSRLHDLNLEDIVTVLHGRSEDMVDRVPNDIYLLHIDGNHSEEKSTLDVRLYLPKVISGGYVILDDTNWPTVNKASEMLMDYCDLVEKVERDGQAFSVYKKK